MVLVLLIGFLVWYLVPSGQDPVLNGPKSNGEFTPKLSLLASSPDWSRLDRWQKCISREEFERRLVEVFTTGDAWRDVIEITDCAAMIRTGSGDEVYRLEFGNLGIRTGARGWRTAEDLPPAPDGRPLHGLHIAIDPGHIGGEWAQLEERWLQVDGAPPVKEGDMTLQVARMIRPRLEALGARVSMVRDSCEPVTSLRPSSLERLARKHSGSGPDEDVRKLAERLFYRTAEIRARAELVNRMIQPDLVLCLHFNAESWGDPENPELVDQNHFHLLLNGAYTDEEVRLADQRFAMIQKLLSRTFDEELRVASTVAGVFARISQLPPYHYPSGSGNVRAIPGEPYLWARNLMANRLYECPVIFFEPYVMNSTIDHPRMVLGDYDGTREIAGKNMVSIFREYADAVVEGLRSHYGMLRE